MTAPGAPRYAFSAVHGWLTRIGFQERRAHGPHRLYAHASGVSMTLLVPENGSLGEHDVHRLVGVAEASGTSHEAEFQTDVPALPAD